jgi:hypothetical protein
MTSFLSVSARALRASSLLRSSSDRVDWLVASLMSVGSAPERILRAAREDMGRAFAPPLRSASLSMNMSSCFCRSTRFFSVRMSRCFCMNSARLFSSLSEIFSLCLNTKKNKINKLHICRMKSLSVEKLTRNKKHTALIRKANLLQVYSRLSDLQPWRANYARRGCSTRYRHHHRQTLSFCPLCHSRRPFDSRLTSCPAAC